jgi:hypothetical protein
MRPQLLNDNEEPKCKKSSTESVAPKRAKLRSEIADPSFVKSMTDKEKIDPKRFNPRTATDAPSRVNFLTESDAPRYK